MTLNLSSSRIVIVIRSSHRSLRRWIPSGRSAYDGSKSRHYNLAATNQKMIISIMSTNNHTLELSAAEIDDLKKAGYTVHTVVDQDPVLYGWMHPSSTASQSHYTDRQPFRKSQAQAWLDCYAYHHGHMPMKAEPDWMDKPAS
ncbi:hypothetical protein [Burkholderia cepacia]|uniref:hypothetical protein n=1 Tax=Burkholderia cepacia TaxID=292 RepID=UPI002ABE2665|nr:hypothetical protein [Burkholderia cepacia]